MISRISQFLKKNTVKGSKLLPITHVSQAYHIRSMMYDNIIKKCPCDVFKDEELTYYFVGRPSYKKPIDRASQFWELPVCFIMDYGFVSGLKRLFPFDSGGFKKKSLPGFATMMPIEEFQLEPTEDNICRLIGAFYASERAYFHFDGYSEELFLEKYSVDPLDAEIMALQKLSKASSAESDDREFCIEIQSEKNADLNKNSVLAVIAPITYLDSELFVKKVNEEWEAELMTYDVLPVNSNSYQLAIYENVKLYLQENGLI